MSLFNKLADKYRDNLAVISDKEETLTYADLDSISRRIKDRIQKRSLVFCLCENTIGSFCGYFSFINNGIVPLMLDTTINKDLLDNLIEIYKPNYLWLNNSLLKAYQDNQIEFSEYSFSLVLLSVKKVELNDELALLLTTSGSTGSPKLVRLCYENILANAESIAKYLQITNNERPVTSLPMSYSYGLSVLNSHLIKGATILLTDKSIAQKDYWNFVKEQKATSMAGVPYTYEMLKRLRFFRMDLPHLKTLTQAGGKLSPDLVKEFVDYAIQTDRKFFVMYGQTEATARMSYLPFHKAAEKYSSMGVAIPGGKFSLINEKGIEIEVADSDGELIYTGKNVSLGYAECLEDLSKGDENLGVLHTCDIARRDNDGYYYITGRMKRFIKIYGNRLNLDASEQIVKTITPDCACVGRDDKMIVYITDQSLCTMVRDLLVNMTGINNLAFDVRAIQEIPKNDSGKVQYAKLKNE
jgi:acyl-coenzyme A synthetase/AMP-(fatty) acid ligase